MYKVNDYVVYKGGVCYVKEIKKNKQFNRDYYILKPLCDSSLSIEVPTENKKGLIRNIISKDDAINFMDEIKNIKPIIVSDTISEIDYKKYLITDKKEDLISIIKSAISEIERRKQFGKKERELDVKYLNIALELLETELSVSLDKSKEEIRNFIEQKCRIEGF